MASDSNGDSSGKALALLGAVFVGLFVGGGAVFLQRLYAPFGVFPLLIGMLVGAAALIPLLAVRRRSFLLTIVVAFFAALGCSVAHHYGTFLVARREMIQNAEAENQARRHIEAQLAQQGQFVEAATPKPITLGEYYEYQWHVGRPLGEKRVVGAGLAGWWALDGLLIWFGAAIVTASFSTRPGSPAGTGREGAAAPLEGAPDAEPLKSEPQNPEPPSP